MGYSDGMYVRGHIAYWRNNFIRVFLYNNSALDMQGCTNSFKFSQKLNAPYNYKEAITYFI